jgi:hypothetical protein
MLSLCVAEIQTTRNLCYDRDNRNAMVMGGAALLNVDNKVAVYPTRTAITKRCNLLQESDANNHMVHYLVHYSNLRP